jgi:hypothetical protein
MLEPLAIAHRCCAAALLYLHLPNKALIRERDYNLLNRIN